MALVSSSLSPLTFEALSLHYVKDASLGNVPLIVFYGPSTTTNANANSSRVQAHIFSVAGYKSFPRLTIVPSSTLYAAVTELPIEQQGDETCRGLAVSLFKYFQEIPNLVRQALSMGRNDTSADHFLDHTHAASLVSKMTVVHKPSEIATRLLSAFREQRISWTDVDVIAEQGAVRLAGSTTSDTDGVPCEPNQQGQWEWGPYSAVIRSIGSATFLPTSKLRRAPSQQTGLTRSKAFDADSLPRLRYEFEELYSTESNYLLKVHDLITCLNATQERLHTLSSNNPVQFGNANNTSLLHQLHAIAEVSESFLADLARLSDNLTSIISHDDVTTKGASNELVFVSDLAQLFLEYAPRFSEPYRNYLLQSATFSSLVAERESKIDRLNADATPQIGEQRLKSWLIEPVQRLPRYALFLDNISSLLPSTHRSLKQLLLAKDMINNICALDHEDSETDIGIKRLKKLVERWPDSLKPTGRLIAAADAIIVATSDQNIAGSCPRHDIFIVLLTDVVLVLEKISQSTLSARGLIAELERPKLSSSQFTAASLIGHQPVARIVHVMGVQSIQLRESDSDRLLSMTSPHTLGSFATVKDNNFDASYISTLFQLQGAYEGRASKWAEEMVRARIEQRYPEALRESRYWSYHSLQPNQDEAGLAAAVYIYNSEFSYEPYSRGHLSILLSNIERGQRLKSGSQTSTLPKPAIRITFVEPASYRLESVVSSGDISTEYVTEHELACRLPKVVSKFLSSEVYPDTLEKAYMNIAEMQRVLCTLQPRHNSQHSGSRAKLRPMSPVKVLSSLLSSNPKDRGSPGKRSTALDFDTRDRARLCPISVPGSQEAYVDEKTVSSIYTPLDTSVSSLQQLESTLDTYLVAINCRAGNVVGKSLRNRTGVNEARVNEVYNALNDDPHQHRIAAEVSVDVLFSAFEKFVRYEWSHRIGPILSDHQLLALQSLFSTTIKSNVAEQFSNVLMESSPQNRRALFAIVRLLYELLEASGNDGDRGVITASFSEILAGSRNSQKCLPLLDRLVEDIDCLFEGHETVTNSSDRDSRSPSHMHSVNSTSLSSAGSSLRRKFGLPKLSRENSRLDSESRVGQMWRTLSKKSSNLDHDSSANIRAKIVLGRSKSTDRNSQRRGVTADQPANRPCSADSLREETWIHSDGSQVYKSRGPTRTGSHKSPAAAHQRRRSSISDLRGQSHTVALNSCDAESSIYGAVHSARAPQQTPLTSPGRAETLGGLAKTPVGIQASGTTASDRFVVEQRPQSPSAKATTREPLAERKGFGDNQILAPRVSAPSPRKTQALHAHKIKEHLDKEATNIETNQLCLQPELADLRLRVEVHGDAFGSVLRDTFTRKMDSLETQIKQTREESSREIKQIRNQLDRSLAVNEQQRKKLEKMYTEVNAENELLYDRYNSELLRVFQECQKDGTEGVLEKLQQVQNEAKNLRKENQRLKRENAYLKAEVRN